ncbi:MAG: CAP domain-containing protein [Crocinitomicaceae bacterium]
MRQFLFFICLLTLASSTQTKQLNRVSFDEDEMLKRHNHYRKQVGVPPLEWSDDLADYAQEWANKLSKKCDMYHSTGPYGENIFWTSGSASPSEVVDNWAEEKRYFNHKNPIYRARNGNRYGHYTQIVWKETTHVGGAFQKCRHGGEIWVCSYSPHGNIIGEKAF